MGPNKRCKYFHLVTGIGRKTTDSCSVLNFQFSIQNKKHFFFFAKHAFLDLNSSVIPCDILDFSSAIANFLPCILITADLHFYDIILEEVVLFAALSVYVFSLPHNSKSPPALPSPLW